MEAKLAFSKMTPRNAISSCIRKFSGCERRKRFVYWFSITLLVFLFGLLKVLSVRLHLRSMETKTTSLQVSDYLRSIWITLLFGFCQLDEQHESLPRRNFQRNSIISGISIRSATHSRCYLLPPKRCTIRNIGPIAHCGGERNQKSTRWICSECDTSKRCEYERKRMY